MVRDILFTIERVHCNPIFQVILQHYLWMDDSTTDQHLSLVYLLVTLILVMLSCYRPQTKLRKGNVFTRVCQEFCPGRGVVQDQPGGG